MASADQVSPISIIFLLSLTDVNLSVLNVFSSWLMKYHMVELEPTVVDQVKQFLMLIKSHPQNKSIAKRLIQVIDTMVRMTSCLFYAV